ncbi:hypothetical protein [Streptococcus pyogenes]|nr:hypothetical protein [Streptococcus pyogenes]
MANLSDNIKYFRKQNKLTQKELAKNSSNSHFSLGGGQKQTSNG